MGNKLTIDRRLLASGIAFVALWADLSIGLQYSPLVGNIPWAGRRRRNFSVQSGVDGLVGDAEAPHHRIALALAGVFRRAGRLCHRPRADFAPGAGIQRDWLHPAVGGRGSDSG